MSLARADVLREIRRSDEWEVIVIGGGATGLGTAVEAASRGYRTLLLEAHDFAKGTSSRSTKLVHGGVRYLQQGNIKLVLEALHERGLLLRNAPHLSHRRAFVIPAYSLWELPFYGTGLTAYDLLARGESLGHSKLLSPARTRQLLPTVSAKGLKGGILYYDGQFDDARLAVALLRTLFDLGGFALNYAGVCALHKRSGLVSGVSVEDGETGARFDCGAKVVVNATGIFSDSIRRMDAPDTPPIITVSQGSHIVLPGDFLPSDAALMIPRTSDGRVLFAIPWHGRTLVGTTDDPVPDPQIEPKSMSDEREFLLSHVARFFGRSPRHGEIRSIWSGQRPLVRRGDASNTAALSRDHTILISDSRLITVTGGKWTTYRRMGQDVVDRAVPLASLPSTSSRTAGLRLHGWTNHQDGIDEWEGVYGSDLPALRQLAAHTPDLDAPLHPLLPFRRAEVVWAARHEMARTVEDVLARRTRALFLDARASIECAPAVAELMAQELGRDPAWQKKQIDAFQSLAANYVWND